MASKKEGKASTPTAERTRKPRGAKAASAPVTEDLLAVMVLDESGSMSYTIGTANVVESVDEYIGGLREDEANSDGKTLLSLTSFSGGPSKHWHVAEPVADIPSIGLRYGPNGGTALFDAIAYSLVEADRKLRESGQENMKVLHVTISDGGENASRDYPMEGNGGNAALASLTREFEFLTPQERATLSQDAKDEIVASRAESDEPQGTWTFVWLNGGVNNQAAAMAAGSSIGYRPENSIMFAASAGGTSNSMNSLRSATNMRKTSSAATSSSFFADAGQSLADYADPNSSAAPVQNLIGSVPGGPAVPVTGDVANAAGVKIEKDSISNLLGGGK